MSRDFGFIPVSSGERYFISYKTEDEDRVREITRCLNERGVPMWYDYGLEPGEEWERQISRHLRDQDTKAMIMFATKDVFSHEDTFVRTEYGIAKLLNKKKYVVWLDDVSIEDVFADLSSWFVEVGRLQGVRPLNKSYDDIARIMVEVFRLIHNHGPQPPTPSYDAVNTDSSNIFKPDMGKTPESESSKSQYHVGDTIHFGSYPYEADGEKKKLEWRILAVEKDRMLIITQDLIECAPYNKVFKAVTWENCTLRKWMNVEFLDIAFDENEKSRIVLGTNSDPDNKRFNTEDGRKTEDRVFALSIDEVRRYFKNDSDRMAAPTPYVEEKYKDKVFISGPNNVKGRGTGWWWLRSPGFHSYYAALVGSVGHVDGHGLDVDGSGASVRPALWLNL